MANADDSEPVELNISADTVNYIISRARQYDSGEDTLISGGDTTASELREAIDDLNDDEVVDLIALAWVGRGDFSRDDWEDARALVRERHQQHSAGYLMGIPTLADYLEEGLVALGHTYETPG